jgi:hypothetical protein
MRRLHRCWLLASGADRAPALRPLAHAVKVADQAAGCGTLPDLISFGRPHQKLRVTPAMEAALADHVWAIDAPVALLWRAGEPAGACRAAPPAGRRLPTKARERGPNGACAHRRTTRPSGQKAGAWKTSKINAPGTSPYTATLDLDTENCDMEDEWTTVVSGGRLVKFTYSDLPQGGAFLTAQIAGHEVVYSVILQHAEHPCDRAGVERHFAQECPPCSY